MILATAFSGLWKECRGRMSGSRPQSVLYPCHAVSFPKLFLKKMLITTMTAGQNYTYLYIINAASLDILVTTNSVAVRVCRKIGYKSVQVYQHSGVAAERASQLCNGFCMVLLDYAPF